MEIKDLLERWIESACEADQVEPEEFIDEATGPPLSKDEIAQAREQLSQWQSSAPFSDEVLRLCKRCTPRDFFNRPELKFLHDAFVLAQFATRLPADRVKLSAPNEPFPDGYVRTGDGNVHEVEVTSDHGKRKLGDEYMNLVAPALDPVEKRVERGRLILDALEGAITAKVNKHYPGRIWLVVYLNINEYGLLQAETERAIDEIKQRHVASFDAIFVLWKDKLL